MENWVAIVISLVAAGMAGAALWLSLKQDRRANEHHDVEWQPKWVLYTLFLTNHGTVPAHDVQVVVDYGENSRSVQTWPFVDAEAVRILDVKDFLTHKSIHDNAGGKDFEEEARIRITWRTKHGTPKTETIQLTLK